MKKLLCALLALCCFVQAGLCESEFHVFYISAPSGRTGEVTSISTPLEEMVDMRIWPGELSQVSLGVGNMFLYVRQGMLIVEHSARTQGDYCIFSYRTEDEWGKRVLEFRFEYYTPDGQCRMDAVYEYVGGEWLLEMNM